MGNNLFGVYFVDESLSKKIEKEVYDKMEELETEANKKFEQYLDKNNLEMAMGVIVKKGTIK